MVKLITISELARSLNLINSKNQKPKNYILRYWEKVFKEIKPVILRNRRYYSKKQVEKIELINFLLKDRGLTINGVKKVLKKNVKSLDDYNSDSLKASYQKDYLKEKSRKILEKIKKLKKNGKKISYKS